MGKGGGGSYILCPHAAAGLSNRLDSDANSSVRFWPHCSALPTTHRGQPGGKAFPPRFPHRRFMSQSCRWGILGSAGIARKIWTAIRLSENGHVVAVASRDALRSRSFVEACQAELPMQDSDGRVRQVEPLGDYDSLLARDDIDAVYVPLPTSLRRDWVIAAAEAGKHVLCEKPAANHADDLDQMISACEDAGVQFMDGVMFDHASRTEAIADSVAAGDLGSLQRVQTHFSFCGGDEFESKDIRSHSELEPHGCLGDLGWYCIRMTLWISGFELPVRVSGRSRVQIGDGVPGEFIGEMEFADGWTAGLFCSFRSANQQTAWVSGSEGYATLDDFVLPMHGGRLTWETHRHVLDIDRCRWNFNRRSESHHVGEYSAAEPGAQEVRMIEKMQSIVLDGPLDPNLPRRSLQTQKVLDAMRQSDIERGQWVEP